MEPITKNEADRIFEEEFNLDEKEILLLQLLFEDNYGKQEVEKLVGGLDLETASFYFLVVLAHLGFAHQWQYFPELVKIRLQGIHRFYRVRNATLLPGGIAFIKQLQHAGIEVMLLKGSAMKAGYTPSIPRIMSDMDVMVRKRDFARSLALAKKNFSTYSLAPQSVDFGEGLTRIDLHHMMLKNGAGNTDAVWQRAVKTAWHGISIFVPSPEDMLILVMFTEFTNMVCGDSRERKIKWIFDAGHLLPKVDWNKLEMVSHELHAEAVVGIMSRILAQYFPQAVHVSSSLAAEENLKRKLAAGYKKEKDLLGGKHRLSCFHCIDKTKIIWYKYEMGKLVGLDQEYPSFLSYYLYRVHTSINNQVRMLLK